MADWLTCPLGQAILEELFEELIELEIKLVPDEDSLEVHSRSGEMPSAGTWIQMCLLKQELLCIIEAALEESD